MSPFLKGHFGSDSHRVRIIFAAEGLGRCIASQHSKAGIDAVTADIGPLFVDGCASNEC